MNISCLYATYYRRLLCLAVVCSLLLFLFLPRQAQAQVATDIGLPGLIITLSAPANTPPNASVYIAGSFNGWQPDAASYKLTAQGNGKYSIALPAEVRGNIEFKFTLGSWGTGEITADGSDAPNRSFDIPAASASHYEGTVEGWKIPAATIAELKLELEKILAETHTPGLSLAIVRKAGVEWAAGLGLADVANQRPATAETLFRIGSVSKNFTSLAILQLVNQGKLSLQDPVRKLVPEVWFENPWEDTDPVRVVDLLEHTTGWNDMHLREYAKDAPDIKLSDALNYHHGSRVSRWRPGTRMSYCNSGPAVAAAIVEKLTGQVFEDYVQQNLFVPIGMSTATFFQPEAGQTTLLYHQDGKSPFPYWHILLRPAGSINASANDMAAYLSFFLHRGEVNGSALLPASSIDRVEIPTRTWAAQQGLSAGYGLYNLAFVSDGRVFHGHDGGVNGGLTSFTYLPDEGIGFFYSINSGNGEAHNRIGSALRNYITRGLAKPEPAAAASLPDNIHIYNGWYEPASLRQQNFYFAERLLRLSYFNAVDGQLRTKSIMQQESTYIPVSGNLFRLPTDPIATLALISPNSEGVFIGQSMTALRQIPTWLVYLELGLVAGFVLAITTSLIYASFWLVAGCLKGFRKPQELWLKVWPLIAALSLVAIFIAFYAAGEDFILQFGNMTVYSVGVCLATLIFAMASIASAVALLFADRQQVRRFVYLYLSFVAAMLIVASLYLGYWGVIGIRLWA